LSAGLCGSARQRQAPNGSPAQSASTG
jgi:hypothetical protein